MGDASPPENISVDPEQLKIATEQALNLDAALGSIKETIASTPGLAEALGLRQGEAAGENFKKKLVEATDSADKLKKSVDSVGTGMMSFDKLSTVLQDVGGAAAEAAKRMGKAFEANRDDLVSSLKTVIPGAAAVMGEAGALAALAFADNASGGLITKMQRPVMEIKKAGLQMGLGMGEGFKGASKHTDSFHQNVVDTMLDTKSSMKEVMDLNKVFVDSFKPEEINVKLSGLTKGFHELRGAVNLTNVAMLVAKAKGMDEAKVAGMMAIAHTELGASVEDSAKMLGDIALAAEKSGLSFSKVSDSVIKGAQSLKLWGGTVGSVTPLYKAFADSLDEGKKGLAPELMEKYVSGIADMGFEMKAFVGMSGGMGGGGGGALVAGLEMEELMSKGAEGTAEISQKISDMLKERTGGPMLSRKEAIAGGAEGAKQYETQNRLIQQFMGMDRGSANATMEMMKKVEESGGFGAAGAGDAEAELAKAMTQGQSVQDQTTDAIVHAEQKLVAAQLSAGKNIVEELTKITAKIGGRIPTAMGQIKERMARTGKADFQTLGDITSVMGGKRSVQKTMDTLGVRGKGERSDVKSGEQRAKIFGDQLFNDMNANLERRRKQMLKDPSINKKDRKQLQKGDIKTDDFMDIFQSSLDDVAAKMSTLKRGEGTQERSFKEMNTGERAQLMKLEAIEAAIKEKMSMENADMGKYNARKANRIINKGERPGGIEIGQPVVGGQGAGGLDAIDKIIAGGGIPLAQLGKLMRPSQKADDKAAVSPVAQDVGTGLDVSGILVDDLKKYGLLKGSERAPEPPTAIRTAEGGFDFGAEGVAAPGQEDLSNTINSIAASMEALAPGSTGNLKAGLPVEEAMAATEGVKMERIKLEFAESEPLEQKVNFHFEQTGDGTYRAVVDEVATAKIVRKIQNEGR